MMRIVRVLSAVSLVLFPLLVLVYWLLYPAYGLLDAGAILKAIDGHATRTTIADAFIFTATFLAVLATLALARALVHASPKLAIIGGGLTLVGWVALIGAAVGDPVAVEFIRAGPPNQAAIDLYSHIVNSPIMIGLNVLATLHIVGAVVLGAALIRTRLIPRWAAVTATIAAPIHFAANVSGVLWLDELTWIGFAIAYGFVAAHELKEWPAHAAGGSMSVLPTALSSTSAR